MMNEKHREMMDMCYKDIVPKIDIIKLWPKLLENKVFNRDDVNLSHWKKHLVKETTVRDIYLTIKTRGPCAFERFLISLKQSNHEDLADILEGKRTKLPHSNIFINDKQSSSINNVQTAAVECNFTTNVEDTEDNFFHNIQLSEVPLQIQVRKANKFLDGPVYENVQRYPMRSKPRGLVLIITNIHYKYPNNAPRSSAAYDELNLKHLFREMGFHVISYLDLTGQELLDRVKEFSQSKDLRKVDSCFVIISGHGHINTQYEVTEIEGVDYNPESKLQNCKPVLCVNMLDYFTAETCPHLAGKPKIFIFQLCRGLKTQKSVKEPRHTTDISNFHTSDEVIYPKVSKSKETMRNYADMLVAHATLPGHVAFRDTITGSWFIQILCEVFMNYAHKTHIQDLLSMVDERLKIPRTDQEECQTLMVTSIGFNKHCYLNPGLFEQV